MSTNDDNVNNVVKWSNISLERDETDTARFKCKNTDSDWFPKFSCASVALYLGLILTSILCGVMWFTNIYRPEVAKRLTLYDGSILMAQFANSSVKSSVCIYAFNYTNAHEFLANSDNEIRPKVQEVGPYCYTESIARTNIVFNDDDGTLTFNEFRTHEFDEDSSRGNKDDILTLPNIPIFEAISIAKNHNTLIRRGLAFSLRLSKSSALFVNVKAHDYIIGYNEPLTKTNEKIAKFLQKNMPFDKFGTLATRSGLNKDRITIQGGYKDLDHFGDVIAVNGVSRTDKWKTDECNTIAGSYGTFFSKKLLQDKSRPLHVYNKDICRSLPLVYKEQFEYQEEMLAVTYRLPANIFASPKRNIYNECFCKRESKVDCLDGIFDLAPCSSGLPIVVSQPHFLHADPTLIDAIDGLSPNETLHESTFHIHRDFGITIGAEYRMQTNVRVTKVPEVPISDYFADDTVLPVVWIEIGVGQIRPEMLSFYHQVAISVDFVEEILKYGSICLIIVLLLLMNHSCRVRLLQWSSKLRMKLSFCGTAQNINMRNVNSAEHKQV